MMSYLLEGSTIYNFRIWSNLIIVCEDMWQEILKLFWFWNWIFAGELRIKYQLDRETTSSYTLTLKARDGGSPPESSTAQIGLTITDVNDNKPIFDKLNYVFKLPENTNLNASVGTVSATDSDEGQNAVVSYEIENGKDAKTFFIDTNSGSIILVKEVDHERQSSYAIAVTAKDHGTPPLTSTVDVKIVIQDVNDNPPSFPHSQYNCTVAENLASDIAVCYVTAVDPDSGPNGQLVYSITAGNTKNAFRIDSVSFSDKEKLGYFTQDRETCIPQIFCSTNSVLSWLKN